MEGDEPDEELELDPEPGSVANAHVAPKQRGTSRLLQWTGAVIAGFALLCCVGVEADPTLPFLLLEGPATLFERPVTAATAPAALTNGEAPPTTEAPSEPAPKIDLSRYKRDPIWDQPSTRRATPPPKPQPSTVFPLDTPPTKAQVFRCNAECGYYMRCLHACATHGDVALGVACMDRRCPDARECSGDCGNYQFWWTPERDESIHAQITGGFLGGG